MHRNVVVVPCHGDGVHAYVVHFGLNIKVDYRGRLLTGCERGLRFYSLAHHGSSPLLEVYPVIVKHLLEFVDP